MIRCFSPIHILYRSSYMYIAYTFEIILVIYFVILNLFSEKQNAKIAQKKGKMNQTNNHKKKGRSFWLGKYLV